MQNGGSEKLTQCSAIPTEFFVSYVFRMNKKEEMKFIENKYDLEQTVHAIGYEIAELAESLPDGVEKYRLEAQVKMLFQIQVLNGLEDIEAMLEHQYPKTKEFLRVV